MTVADRLSRMIAVVVGVEPQVRIRGWDGSETGPAGAPLIEVRSRTALRYVLHQPNQLGLGRAYVAGHLDVAGDIFDALEHLTAVFDRRELTRTEKAELLRQATLLGAVGPEPAPPAEEISLTGTKHSRDRDRAAISHHYDVGNEFYRIVLGSSMVYSCAYWTSLDAQLEQAQYDKLDLICRKLQLRPGQRVLDVGCGWGSLALHAAEHHGVTVVGVTLSAEQLDYARARATEAELDNRLEFRLEDYRDITDGPYDAIASVGMAEHVGEETYTDYCDRLFDLLRPGGRLLNHQISRKPTTVGTGPSFIDSYVFPDAGLSPIGTTVSLIENSGFEVRDTEALREHYTRTLRAWTHNLEAGWDRAVALAGEGRSRVWRLYMAASALAFQHGRIGIHQVLAVRPGAGGLSGMPPTRTEWLGTTTSAHTR